MKKFQYYLTATFFALFATLSFTACSDDDEDDLKSDIVGMWQATHISGLVYEYPYDTPPVKIDRDIKSEDSERYLFNADGTCYSYYYSEDTNEWESVDYTYKVNDNKIIVYEVYEGEVEELVTYTVLSLTDEVMVLQCYREVEEDCLDNYTITYKKVK